jgi:23S rRNA (uracil1939-C5)-methyltransferase
VESIEGDRRAVDLAHRHPGLRGLRSAQGGPSDLGLLRAGKVEELIGSLQRPDLVITNPPRVGMHERVADALAASPASRIIYVSCDPATLARDVARLGRRWKVTGVRGFDLFPQTAHVETVLTLEAA